MSDSEAPWPKNGLAGQISAAKRLAPDDANDMQILTVGYRAWEDGDTDVRELWDEVMADGE